MEIAIFTPNEGIIRFPDHVTTSLPPSLLSRRRIVGSLINGPYKGPPAIVWHYHFTSELGISTSFLIIFYLGLGDLATSPTGCHRKAIHLQWQMLFQVDVHISTLTYISYSVLIRVRSGFIVLETFQGSHLFSRHHGFQQQMLFQIGVYHIDQLLFMQWVTEVRM